MARIIAPQAGKAVYVDIGGRQVRLSNLDKVLYASTGFTKADVLDYYVRAADVLLGHLAYRPLTLKRYPDGVAAEFFYEKQCPTHAPDWVPTVSVWSRGNQRNIRFCMVDSVSSLAWVANLASIELHTSLARADDVDRPTMLVFDLDPGPPAGLLDCGRVALELREVLLDLGLESFIKVSGGKGLHLYVPLNTPVTFDQTRTAARLLAELLATRRPDAVVTNMRKDLRIGKVLVDWSQNDQHKTTVCVYSLRARERPSVSMPIRWEELRRALSRQDDRALAFDPPAALRRIRRAGDLFEPVLALHQTLPTLG